MKRYVVILILALLLITVNINIAAAAPGLQGGEPLVHYVGFGESLTSIAAQYGVSAEAILRVNGLRNPDKLYAGQPLVIPVSGYYGNSANFGQPQAGCARYHTVSAGESFSGIAYQYGLPFDLLLAHNNLYNPNMVYIGQKVCLPAGGSYRPQPANYNTGPHYHDVQAGETLSSIAHHYGVDYSALVRVNHLNNPSFIWVGQRLVIPGYQPEPVQIQPPVYNQPKPHYGAPSASPAARPRYDDAYDDPPPPPKSPPDEKSDQSVPPAPTYQASPAQAELPVANQPIQVVVNGGESWVGEAYEGIQDPNGITTLVVATDDKTENHLVRIQSGDYQVKGELGLTAEFGVDKFRFAFKYIPPGDYDVWIDDPETPSEKVHVSVKPGQRVEVYFKKGLSISGPTYASPGGWYLADWENPSKPGERLGGWSNILVKTPASGLWVMIESEARDYKAKCFTGSKGPGMCDLAALNAGLYYIWIDGTDLTVKTYMDGNAYATLQFARQAVPDSKGDNEIGPVSYD